MVICDDRTKTVDFVIESLIDSGILSELKKSPTTESLEEYKKNHREEYLQNLFSENPYVLVIAYDFIKFPTTLSNYPSPEEQTRRLHLQEHIAKTAKERKFDTLLAQTAFNVTISTPLPIKIFDETDKPIPLTIFMGEIDSPNIYHTDISTRIGF